MLTRTDVRLTVNASSAATAWPNAFLATGQDEDRPLLCRTLSVEFFRSGVHFIACDGTILFRTWVPKHDTDAEWPEDYEVPDRSVVVLDRGHFALGFMRTLVAATKDFEFAELSLAIEAAPEQEGEAPLGAEFSAEVLTIRALGQQLHCRLFETEYVNWRQLQFGVDRSERVDGMKLATRMFASVGKLKGIGAIDCTFTGGERQIVLTGDRSFRGLLMPMRRGQKAATDHTTEYDSEQTDALPETKVKVNGAWVDATPENVALAMGRTAGR